MSPIRVRRGDTFEVALSEPAATGHRWRLVAAPPEVAVVGERYDPPPTGGPLGTPGKRVVTLRAERAGRHRLEFALARPGEADRHGEHSVEVEAS